MSSKKPQFPIPVPNTGVRKDLDQLRQTPDMAEEGINCLYFDGVIRPRPGMTPELFGTEDAQAWQQIYETGDLAGYVMTAYAQMDDGTIIANFVNTAGTGQQLYYSTDMGQSWQVTAHHPRPNITSTGTFTHIMKIFSGKLFLFDLFYNVNNFLCQPDPVAHTPVEMVYRTALTSFPTSVSFQALGPVEHEYDDGGTTNYCTLIDRDGEIIYDATTGHLLGTDVRNSSTYPMTWGLADAMTTTSWVTDFYHIGGDATAPGIGGFTPTPSWFVDGKWLAWGRNIFAAGAEYTVVQNFILAMACEYNSSSSEFEFDTDKLETTALYKAQLDALSVTELENLSEHVGMSAYGLPNKGGYLKETTNTEMIFVVEGSKVDTDLPKIHDVWKMELKDPDDSETSWINEMSVIHTLESADADAQAWRLDNVSDRLAFFMQDESTEQLRGYSSDDDGRTWKLTSLGGPVSDQLTQRVPNWESNSETLQHFIGERIGGLSPYDHSEFALESIWIAPTTGGPGRYGDTTTMIQMDMDDEDAVVVQGTTKALLRLDRANAEWDRLSADHTEEVGADPWVTVGAIPPLGVSDDRAEYASGTSIDGTYGTHPWVFRSFPVQGNTFLIGTNGQCRPICYHDDMAGGFARRMGSVPITGDPNSIDPWVATAWPSGYGQTGNLAPIARCMATAANRVMLGNLPAISAYGIEVSGFNDPDRGWGLNQFTLLSDTPGEIVALNEISALSVALYKTDAIYHAIAQTEFMGVAAPFRFELSKAGVAGPCSPGSVLRNFDGKHIYLARDGGVYMYDGVAPIDAGRNVRRMIQGKIDLDNLGKTWGLVDTERKLVWFFYPSKSGNVNQGLVISTDQGYPWNVWPVQLPQGWDFSAGGAVYLEDDITIGDIGRLGDYPDKTLGSFSSGKQQILMGTRSNTWFSQKWDDDGEYTDSNLPISIDLLNGWTEPGGMHRWTADEVYHIFSSPDPEMEMMITLEAQQFGEEILKSSAVPLSAGRLRRRTRHRVSGTKFRLGIRGEIERSFRWGGGVMSAKRSGDR